MRLDLLFSNLPVWFYSSYSIIISFVERSNSLRRVELFQYDERIDVQGHQITRGRLYYCRPFIVYVPTVGRVREKIKFRSKLPRATSYDVGKLSGMTVIEFLFDIWWCAALPGSAREKNRWCDNNFMKRQIYIVYLIAGGKLRKNQPKINLGLQRKVVSFPTIPTKLSPVLEWGSLSQ